MMLDYQLRQNKTTNHAYEAHKWAQNRKYQPSKNAVIVEDSSMYSKKKFLNQDIKYESKGQTPY